METLVYIIIGFWGYFIISWICYQLKVTKVDDAVKAPNPDSLAILNLRHLLGIVIFGGVCWVIFQNSEVIFFKRFMDNQALIVPVAFFATICMDLSVTDAHSKIIVPGSSINYKQCLSYIILRLLFLLAYEVFFRGVLFWYSLQFTNLVNAIIINLFFYALIHITESKKEILGSIPFGLVLCLFTYYSGSIWPAFIIHASLSIWHEAIIISKGLTKIQKS